MSKEYKPTNCSHLKQYGYDTVNCCTSCEGEYEYDHGPYDPIKLKDGFTIYEPCCGSVEFINNNNLED